MHCDQCVAAMINGVFCHEIGCPNKGKVWDADEQRWMYDQQEIEELYDELVDEYGDENVSRSE